MTERTIMTEKTRLRPGESTTPKKNFATTEMNDIGDDGNSMRKIERGHESTRASLDDHFPQARNIGIGDEQERHVNGAGQLENSGGRHSGDATR